MTPGSNLIERAILNYLTRTLGGVSGLPAKLAQTLAMRSGVSADHVRAKTEALPLDVVRELISERAPKLHQALCEISPAFRVASLAQVHRARLESGEDVVVKLQFPEMATRLKSQMKWLLKAARVSPAARAGVNFSAYDDFLVHALTSELDYAREASTQTHFTEQCSALADVRIPRVYAGFSTASVLVQELVEGLSLYELKLQEIDARRQASAALLRFELHSLFRLGEVHADLQPDNWAFDLRQQCLVVYDFGSTVRLGPLAQAAMLRWACGQGRPLEIFADLGFDLKKLQPIYGALDQLSALLIEPLRDPDWHISSWHLRERLDSLLGAEKWAFRGAGPPWFFLFLRSVSGVIHALSELNADVSPANILSELMKIEPPRNRIPVGSAAGVELRTERTLKVLVRERQSTIAELEFPVRTVDDLESLIPAETARRIAEQGVSLRELSAKAVREGYRAQVLFEANNGERSYKVWISEAKK